MKCVSSVLFDKSETFQRDFQNKKRRLLSLLSEMRIKTGKEFFRKSHKEGFICLYLAFLSMMIIHRQVGVANYVVKK